MSGKDKLQREIMKTLGGYQESRKVMPAVLGNGGGIVSVPSRPGYVYVRINKDVVQVYNERVPNVNDFPVLVGYDHLNPRLLQVLSTNLGTHFGTEEEPNWDVASNLHHQTHEWMNPQGGEDVVEVQLRQMLPLRVIGMTGTSTVAVYRGFVPDMDHGWSRVNFQYVDLSPATPTGTLGRYMLISAQTDGNLVVTTGTAVNKNALYLNNIPDQLYGTYPLAAVRLYGQQTNGIEEGLTDTDIVDLRWYPHIRPSGTVKLYDNGLYQSDSDRLNFYGSLQVQITGGYGNIDVRPVKKYMNIPAGSFRLGASAPDAGTEGTFATLLFSNAVTEEAYYNLHVPVDWEVGTDFELSVYWSPTSGATGTVAWEFDWESLASNSNETLGTNTFHADIHDYAEGLDNELLETTYGIISGTCVSLDDTIGVRLYRDHDDATDDYGADAALIHLEIEYTSDKIGEYI